MITKIFFLILVFFISTFSWACEIHLPEHILILGQKADLSKIIASTECSSNAISELNETLNNVDGKVSHIQLSEMLKAKNHLVLIQPNLIQIQHFKNIVHEQISMPVGVQMRSSEAMNANNFLALNLGDRIEVNCIGCLFGSQQPINLTVHGLNGSKNSLIVKADFKKMVKAFRMTSFHPAFSQVSAASIKEDFTESIPHTDLFSQIDMLKFYKLNKPLRPGELLRQSDLNPINLVRAGSKTEVIIENELIKLKTYGISRNNAGVGEFVEVFHPQKNKKYQGKVIDLNKVLVEL
jgi:flagella basal body P-ring formation protein FlgA